jgi:hypothetical protein
MSQVTGYASDRALGGVLSSGRWGSEVWSAKAGWDAFTGVGVFFRVLGESGLFAAR